MCGIAGIISSNPTAVTKQRLQLMTDSLQHRGPDGDGFWINSETSAGLGHRRLSIIDLAATGAQPMHYAGRYTITYNGELYNYIELKETLLKKGFAFLTHSDTEVILAAYACYGNECLQHFDGMFAFAIWDESDKTLFCARDRFGEKPFYYVNENDRFIFASEMKALWAIGIPKQMKPSRLLTYLTLGITANSIDQHETFYEQILTLPAGHYLQLQYKTDVTNNIYTAVIKSYWDIDKETMLAPTDKTAIEHFSHLLQTSVYRRLRSDVSIGTSLSGGLDSSAIVALIQQNIQTSGHYKHGAFSAIFPGFKKDESPFIQQVANQFNLERFSVLPNADGLITDMQKLVYHQEEPFQSLSMYAQYKVYELARQQGVTVLLDGQGADETLAGYHKYYHWYWQELLACGDFKTFKKELAAARVHGVTDPLDYRNYIAAFMPSVTSKILESQAKTKLQNNDDINYEYFASAKNTRVDKPTVSHLNEILYFNTRQTGLGELLRYADRNSMAHSCEVRLPFLSHELVEYIFSLPSHFKIREGFTKWILRKSVDHLLPANITWRTDKIGFEPPQQQWLQQKQLVDYQHESRRNLVNKGILKTSILKKPLQPMHAHAAGNFDWRNLCADLCMRT